MASAKARTREPSAGSMGQTRPSTPETTEKPTSGPLRGQFVPHRGSEHDMGGTPNPGTGCGVPPGGYGVGVGLGAVSDGGATGVV